MLGPWIAIVADVFGNDLGQALVIEDGEDGVPFMFKSAQNIAELREEHTLKSCDWWAFNTETGESVRL